MFLMKQVLTFQQGCKRALSQALLHAEPTKPAAVHRVAVGGGAAGGGFAPPQMTPLGLSAAQAAPRASPPQTQTQTQTQTPLTTNSSGGETMTMVASTSPPAAPVVVKEGQEEEAIKRWCEKDPQRASIRALAEFGVGKRFWLSSLREPIRLRAEDDPLSSLNSQLLHPAPGARLHTPAEQGLLRMATFLHRELPIRFAKGIQAIDALDVYREAPHLANLRSAYVRSFMEVVNSPCPTTPASEESFVKTLERVRDRHLDDLLMIARGVYELRAKLGVDVLGASSSFDDLHAKLDRMHLKRIANRILIGHYLALHLEKRKDYVGIICLRTVLQDVVQAAATDARWICKKRYGGRAPQVEVIGGDGLTLACIPENVYYVLFELIKNSLRAVAERYHDQLLEEEEEMYYKEDEEEEGRRSRRRRGRGSLAAGEESSSSSSITTTTTTTTSVPPIQVIISKDYSLTEGAQVVIEVKDKGGGIAEKDMDKIFCYLFTTSDPEVQQSIIGGGGGTGGGRSGKKAVPLAGLGYGLGISKQYAEYFGGRLEIQNSPGEGCSVIVTLSRLGDQKEPFV